MTDLFHEGWLRKPVPQWEAMNARYRFDTYELGHKATAALAERGLLTTHRLGTGSAFRHEFMVCLIMASFELAATGAGITLLSWKDVLAQSPIATRDSDTPFVIPMSFSHRGRTFDRPLRPDGTPFGLQPQPHLLVSGHRGRSPFTSHSTRPISRRATPPSSASSCSIGTWCASASSTPTSA